MAYQRTTLATLRLRLQERWESVPFWSNGEALWALNEALRKWNLYTGQWKTILPLATVANQVWYTLPSTLVLPFRAEWQSYPLTVSSLEDIDNFRSRWEGETTATGGIVPTRPKLIIPAGMSLIAIWPADSVGGSNMLLDGVRQTPTLAADTDFVDLGEEELHALLGEALCLAAFKEGGARFTACQRFHQEFLQAAAYKSGRLRASSVFRKMAGLDVARQQRPRAAQQGAQVNG